MLKKCLKCIVIPIPILMGVILTIFVILRTIPDNPVTTIPEEYVNQAVIDKVNREMGLDQFPYIQFFWYMSNVLKGDFGTPYKLNCSVTKIILEVSPNTTRLPVHAAMIAWVIGTIAGIAAAVKQSKLLNHLLTGCALMGISVSVSTITLASQYVFTLKLKPFLVSGYDSFACMVLSAIVLRWNPIGSIVRVTRSNLVGAMQGDYMRMARVRRLRERGVIVHHVLKNAMLPVVTVMALRVFSVLSSAALTENTFGIPGVGRLAVNVIETRDMPLLQGAVIFTTTLVIVGNLVADMLYSVLNSRIREGT